MVAEDQDPLAEARPQVEHQPQIAPRVGVGDVAQADWSCRRASRAGATGRASGGSRFILVAACRERPRRAVRRSASCAPTAPASALSFAPPPDRTCVARATPRTRRGSRPASRRRRHPQTVPETPARGRRRGRAPPTRGRAPSARDRAPPTRCRPRRRTARAGPADPRPPQRGGDPDRDRARKTRTTTCNTTNADSARHDPGLDESGEPHVSRDFRAAHKAAVSPAFRRLTRFRRPQVTSWYCTNCAP